MSPQQESASTPSAMDRAIEQGAARIRRREWRDAHGLFEQVLGADPRSPEAWEGLATSALCLDDAATSRAANERAYRGYQERGDFRGAARVAIQLALYHDAYRGESAIASGWFERARRLLDTVPAAADHAWLKLDLPTRAAAAAYAVREGLAR